MECTAIHGISLALRRFALAGCIVAVAVSAPAAAAEPRFCYIDTACSAGNQPQARDVDTGQCVFVQECVELWACAAGAAGGDCGGGGGTDCNFSPGCGDAVQDCFNGFCTALSGCNERVKYQGYSFDPTLNECSCEGDPPAAGGCSERVTLAVTIAGSGNVTTDTGSVRCGQNVNCSETFFSGTVLALNTEPRPGHRFQRWSGDADCGDGVVTLVDDTSCLATFAPVEEVGAAATGYQPEQVLCRNLTTGQSVSGPVSGPDWSCEQLGLIVSAGDQVATGAVGPAE